MQLDKMHRALKILELLKNARTSSVREFMKPINLAVYIFMLSIIGAGCVSSSVSEKGKGLEFVELFSSGTKEDTACYRIPAIILL